MTDLKISKDLALPLAIAADSLGIFARKGRGKTYAASVFAEELLDKGVPIVVLDPQGDWWGLRSSASGKKAGYPVVIMGGEHGDLKLEPTSGKVVADFVLNERIPTILDLSEFDSRADEVRFGTAFMDRLFRGKKKGTGTIHLIVDEASTFAPQHVGADEAKLEGTARNIARRGRTRGLGSSWIDQRPAAVNTNVRSQFAGLLVFGITQTHDKKAIKEWVDAKGEDEDRMKEMLAEISGLQMGGAYAWVPDLNIFERIQVRTRRTFDSSATPEPGAQVIEPERWHDVDIEALNRSMADTIEKQKADDPAELRKRIRDLEKQLKTRPTEPVAVEKVVEVPVPLLEPGEVDRIGSILSDIFSASEKLGGIADDFSTRLARIQDWPKPVPRQASTSRGPTRGVRSGSPRSAIPTDVTPSEGLTGPEQRVLDALGWWEAVGVDVPSKGQVGFIAGYRVGKKVGGTYGNILGRLRAQGLIDYPAQGSVCLTTEGRNLYNPLHIEPTEQALQEAIMARLDNPERRVLAAAIEAYPDPISKVELGEKAGYTVGDKVGGTYGNILGRLRSLGLLDYPRQGFVVATSTLFLDP